MISFSSRQRGRKGPQGRQEAETGAAPARPVLSAREPAPRSTPSPRQPLPREMPPNHPTPTPPTQDPPPNTAPRMGIRAASEMLAGSKVPLRPRAQPGFLQPAGHRASEPERGALLLLPSSSLGLVLLPSQLLPKDALHGDCGGQPQLCLPPRTSGPVEKAASAPNGDQGSVFRPTSSFFSTLVNSHSLKLTAFIGRH